MGVCWPAMVSFKDFLLRNRLVAARAVTRLLETATATVGDPVTIPVVARLPLSTRKHQEAAIGRRLSPAWQYSDGFGSALWPARMGACSRNTRGRNHTQDDLQAVEMLHSNPKDIPEPNSLLGNLSHEELSATLFFPLLPPRFGFYFLFVFYCFAPLFFTLHWGAAIYILIYPICCQRIMTTRYDLDAILHFYGRHFLLLVTIWCPFSPRGTMLLRHIRLALLPLTFPVVCWTLSHVA